ncbi:MAG: TIGR02186 family protein [Alphaproteobacteria bacterium]|nr:TIGR02186 family protein [Alphaproteobacteria bacterium]
MKFWSVLFILVFGFALTSPAQAARKVVAANLTDNFVGISEGFDGAKLTLFGVLKNKADAIVVIEGPPVEAKVRTKSRQFGIWINGAPATLPQVPSFYVVASSQPVDKIVSEETAVQYGLDIDKLSFAQDTAGAGYVDVKKDKGMFATDPQGVRILESSLFRVDIRLPPSVPIGTFTAHIYEFSKGVLTAERTENFYVAQIGLNAWINTKANGSPVLYALLALALSLGIGGGSAYLVKRMS